MIYIHNEYDEIVETYNSLDHMYKVMKSRYTALQNKRQTDLEKAHHRGWVQGSIITFVSMILIVLFVLIFKLF